MFQPAFLYRKRRADVLHVVAAKDFRIHFGSVGDGDGAEELFHFAGGRKGDEHAAGFFVDCAESVRDHARAENGFSGMQEFALFADLEEHGALDDVKPLVLMKVEVDWGTALDQVLVLDGEECAARVTSWDFEEDCAEAERVVFSEAVLAGADGMNFG